MNPLQRFPYSCSALALALGVLVAAVFMNINVFELPGLSIVGIEQNEMGEIFMAFLLVVPAVLMDYVTANRERHRERLLKAEQLRVLRVTMRTVQDIVNNNLNQLQLLRLEAEGHVPEEALMIFDETIRDTAAQLMALGNLEVFAERPMASGSGLRIPPTTSHR